MLFVRGLHLRRYNMWPIQLSHSCRSTHMSQRLIGSVMIRRSCHCLLHQSLRGASYPPNGKRRSKHAMCPPAHATSACQQALCTRVTKINSYCVLFCRASFQSAGPGALTCMKHPCSLQLVGNYPDLLCCEGAVVTSHHSHIHVS